MPWCSLPNSCLVFPSSYCRRPCFVKLLLNESHHFGRSGQTIAATCASRLILPFRIHRSSAWNPPLPRRLFGVLYTIFWATSESFSPQTPLFSFRALCQCARLEPVKCRCHDNCSEKADLRFIWNSFARPSGRQPSQFTRYRCYSSPHLVFRFSFYQDCTWVLEFLDFFQFFPIYAHPNWVVSSLFLVISNLLFSALTSMLYLSWYVVQSRC